MKLHIVTCVYCSRSRRKLPELDCVPADAHRSAPPSQLVSAPAPKRLASDGCISLQRTSNTVGCQYSHHRRQRYCQQGLCYVLQVHLPTSKHCLSMLIDKQQTFCHNASDTLPEIADLDHW